MESTEQVKPDPFAPTTLAALAAKLFAKENKAKSKAKEQSKKEAKTEKKPRERKFLRKAVKEDHASKMIGCVTEDRVNASVFFDLLAKSGKRIVTRKIDGALVQVLLYRSDEDRVNDEKEAIRRYTGEYDLLDAHGSQLDRAKNRAKFERMKVNVGMWNHAHGHPSVGGWVAGLPDEQKKNLDDLEGRHRAFSIDMKEAIEAEDRAAFREAFAEVKRVSVLLHKPMNMHALREKLRCSGWTDVEIGNLGWECAGVGVFW